MMDTKTKGSTTQPSESATDADARSVEELREAYFAGDLTEAEFEEQVEAALERGDDSDTGSGGGPDRMLDALAILVGALLIKPILMLTNMVSDSGSQIRYSIENHTIRLTSSNADEDDHPAETAGSLQTGMDMSPIAIYAVVSVHLLASATWQTSPILSVIGLLLAMFTLLQVKAPKATVKVSYEGQGTYVAEGGGE